LLAVVLVAILVFQNRRVRETVQPRPQRPVEQTATPTTDTVSLTVNSGDGRPLQNTTAAWKEGMTVLDLLQQEPRVSFQAQGTGESAFLTELNGVANQGSGGRNWTYSVNGRLADKSFGVYKLRPNDHVLWTFAEAQ
jgi:hypothetical protein